MRINPATRVKAKTMWVMRGLGSWPVSLGVLGSSSTFSWSWFWSCPLSISFAAASMSRIDMRMSKFAIIRPPNVMHAEIWITHVKSMSPLRRLFKITSK